MKNTVLLAIGVSGALVMSALAATLDVKPGLWEVTTQGETTGVPPIPPQVLAQMSPAQRAQMMAAMQGRMNQPTVTRSCLTKKMIDRGMSFDRPGDDHCTQTVTGSSAHSLDVRVVCTGEQREKTTGSMHVDATSRESITGAFNMVSTDGTNTMTMKRTLQGKWLGSNCGNVKPHEE
ncbi:MAG TPA: DUF3617 domain-containing protein [Acetobacteraceae bacterium]|jgi:hypothetical protein|nr:DUF3617 domain-containing protein [Acetobacteraceae bacterium]